MGEQNIEFTGEIKEMNALSTLDSARSEAVTEECTITKSQLACSRVDGAYSRWNTHSITKGTCKVNGDESKVLLAVSGEIFDATKWRVSVVELALKDVIRRVSTQNQIVLGAAISSIRAELERNDSEALCDTTCQTVLHNDVAEVCRSLAETINAMAGFNEDFAAAKLGHRLRKQC